MAGRWSSEHVVAEYRDLQASAMAVDCTGQLALLAGRRTVMVVNLSKPNENVRKIARQSKWDVSAAQWNPHPSCGNRFITACNTRADIWDWHDAGSSTQLGSLKAHTRVISDLDWSPVEANTVATCSVDAFTFVWDTRDVRKPAISLQAVAGASQVKWNKLNSNLLATTHDGDLRIWDPRKGTTPVQYIAAHLSKVHGLDWCPTNEFRLATSSQDCTVKFWDVTNPKQSEGKLPSASPVWRARYTPFGKGLITVVVPQLRRGENSLFLWHLNDLRAPVHTFVGHTDVVLAFQWRKPSDECPDYQLVTWSKDQSLRLWDIEPHLQKACGVEIPDDLLDQDLSGENSSIGSYPTGSSSTMKGSASTHESSEPVNIPHKGEEGEKQNSLSPPAKSSVDRREEIHSPKQPKTLHQEFNLVNIHIPNSNLAVEERDAIKRCFTVSTTSGQHYVKLSMMFPEMYPNNAAPSFQFGEGTTIDKEARATLTKILRDVAMQHVKHNRSCIEPCLRQLVYKLGLIVQEEEKRSPDRDAHYGMQQVPTSRQHPSFLPLFANFGPMQDISVPFPRTSGARFCSAGFLICFGRQSEGVPQRRTSSASDLTPRAMSALSHYNPARTPQGSQPLRNLLNVVTTYARSPPTENSASLTNYYIHRDYMPDSSTKRKPRTRSRSRVRELTVEQKPAKETKPGAKKAGPVIIYNISCLLPLNKQLAESYVLDTTDVPGMCRKNAVAAAAVGRKDLVQMWSLGAMTSSKSLKPHANPDRGPPWAIHPFGRKLLKSMIEHYSSIGDVQTLAMLCCAFGSKFDVHKPISSSAVSRSNSSESKPAIPENSDPTFLATLLDGSNVPSNGWNSSCNAIEQYNPYHTIHPTDTTLKGWNFTVPKMRRSNSWSEMPEEYKFVEAQDPAEIEKEKHEKNMRLLDPVQNVQCDQFKKCYADILYRWGLLNKRADVLKYVSSPIESYKTIEFIADCGTCDNHVDRGKCQKCRSFVSHCAICHMKVAGTASFCLFCGHGGHSQHLSEWFKKHSVCPTGCGCNCIQEMSNLGDHS